MVLIIIKRGWHASIIAGGAHMFSNLFIVKHVRMFRSHTIPIRHPPYIHRWSVASDYNNDGVENGDRLNGRNCRPISEYRGKKERKRKNRRKQNST